MDEFIVDYRLNKKFAFPLAVNSVLVGAGAAVLLFGLLFYYLLGVAVGLALLFLGVLALLFDPGHPFRLWRAILKINRAWTGRGIVFIGCTVFFGLLYLLLQTGKSISPSVAVRISGSLFALFTMLYTGFFVSSITPVPFWNRRLTPALFLFHSVTSGFSISLFLISITAKGYDSIYMLEIMEMGLLSATFILTVFHLTVTAKSAGAARESVDLLLRGGLKYIFFLGAIALGFIIPLALTGYLYFSLDFSSKILFVIFLSVMISRFLGDLSFRYAFLRAGVFEK